MLIIDADTYKDRHVEDTKHLYNDSGWKNVAK